MLTITNILNPLTGGSTTEEYPWVKGQSLSKCVGYEGECFVAWNGRILDKPITDIMPADGEAYTWMAIPEGLKKEEWAVLGNIGLLAMMAFLPVVMPLRAGLYIIGSSLLTLLKDKKQDESMSESYSWDHTNSPSAARGMAMPIIYGKTRVRPTLKNRYIKINNDKQELYALYSLAGHKVDEAEYTDWVDLAFDDNHAIQPGQIVSSSEYPGMSFKFRSMALYWAAQENVPHYQSTKPAPYLPDSKLNSDYWSIYHGTGAFHGDIYINGRSITDFHADAKWETRPGLADQIDIEGFDVTYVNYAQDLALYSSRPILDKKAANIQYIDRPRSLDPNLPWTYRLKWGTHTVLYGGEIYNIEGTSIDISASNNTTYYVWFDPTELKGDKNYFSSTLPPPGAYIMFFINRSVNHGKPEYHGDETTGLNWQILTIDFSGIQNIELIFEFPYGLYGSPVGKSIATASCALFAQYRTRSAYGDEWGSWSNFDFDTIEEFPKIETYVGDFREVNNSSFEQGTYTASWTPWRVGGNPDIDVISKEIRFTGYYSAHIRSWVHNCGRYQTITCEPSTEYTFSAFVYLEDLDPDYNDSGSFRVMSFDGTNYHQQRVDATIRGDWQRVSFTMTTGVSQSSMTVWIGGIGAGYWDSIEIFSNSIQAGIIQRQTPNPFNISLGAVISDNLLDSKLQYQIRTAVSSSFLVTLVNVAGIVYGEEDENGNRTGFSYPGEPLIGIKALASGQISGDLDVQVDVERSKVWVYNPQSPTKTYTNTDVQFVSESDQFSTVSHINKTTYPDGSPGNVAFNDVFSPGDIIIISGSALNNGTNLISSVDGQTITLSHNDVTTEVQGENVTITTVSRWEQKEANNHAWAVYDILANGHPNHPTYPTLGNKNAESIYGCGFSANQIDYESFKAWADYTNGQLGYELNIVFDTFTTAWDAILRICMESWGMIYPQGSKIYAYVDKPTSTSQLFTIGNIHLDTFVQSYADEQQKANMVEITYMDKERHYERTQIAMRTSDWDSGTDPNNPINLTLYGTTSYEQAVSIAQRMLLANELLSNSLSHSVDIDALASEAGDVMEVQHDVLGSYGGRIQTWLENLLSNSGFEQGIYTDAWASWQEDGAPDLGGFSTEFTHYGSYSMRLRSWFRNCGRSQTVECTPSTEYTFSAWVYLEDLNYNDSGTFRIMSFDGTGYYQQYVDTTIRESWQRINFTMTTGTSQTSMTVWLGGQGAGYWDGIQVEVGDTLHVYVPKTGAQLDKAVTLTSASYALKIMDSNGVIDYHTTNLSPGSHTWITFNEYAVWTNSPAQYDVYVLSLASNPVQKYRITDISRSTELRRTITAIQYDERVYEGYAPSSEEPIGENVWAAKTVTPSPATIQLTANALNMASNVRLREVLSTNKITGEIQSSIVVAWDPEQGHARGGWEVWYRDVDETDVDWEGAHEEGTTYAFGKKVEHEGTTYISLEDNNISIPISR